MSKHKKPSRAALAQKMVEAKREKALLPKALFEGNLNLGGIEVPAAVLENNQRIISHNGVFKALRRDPRGNARIEGVPAFMDAKNLQPFINDTLREYMKKVMFVGLDGAVYEGYDARIVPNVCELYLQARDACVIDSENQKTTAAQAEIIMRAIATVGVIALVDEATGFQYQRKADALAEILETFIAKELRPWVKTFPQDYYQGLCKLYDLPFPPKKGDTKFPSFFGTLTNNIIYDRIAPGLRPALKTEAKKHEKTGKMHQALSGDRGVSALREHMRLVCGLLKLAKDKDHFFEMLDTTAPKFELPEE